MSKQFRNLVGLSPRLTLAGGAVYDNFALDQLFVDGGHGVRFWQPRDPKTREPVGPTGLVTILGTEDDKGRIARGFEPLNVEDPDGKLDIQLYTDRTKVVSAGSYELDADGKPRLVAIIADENFYYVKMGTGLVQSPVQFTDPETKKRFTRLWVEDDLLELARRRISVEEHGFHTLGGAEELRDREASVELVGTDSRLIWSKASRSKIYGTTIPQCRWTLFRIARNGGEGAVQDTGVLLRFQGTPDRLNIIDARGDAVVRTIWQQREQKRIDNLNAELALKRLANQKAVAQGELLLEETTAADEPAATPAVA